MKTPQFSIITPTFNRSSQLRRAIESILAQTHTDYELIVIDDGSTDDTQVMLNEFVGLERISIVKQSNQGASAARNNGIKQARGRYICFLDSDDVFTPDHLEKTASDISRQPDIQAFSSKLQFKRKSTNYIKPFKAYNNTQPLDEYLLCDRGSFLMVSLTVESEVARQCLFNTQISYGDDIEFVIKLWKKGCEFYSQTHIGAIIDDRSDDSRLSRSLQVRQIDSLLSELRPWISDKAYLGAQGWFLAKSYALDKRHQEAAKLYLSAIKHNCYSIKMSLIVAAQVFLPVPVYYWVSSVVGKLSKASLS